MNPINDNTAIFSAAAMSAAGMVADADNALTVSIDVSEKSAPLRNILGMCNSPVINSAKRVPRHVELLKALNVKRIRHHDAAIENPGYALVDVSRIFPLFHADADDPRNYTFKPTDDYFKECLKCCPEIEFRLGETIEHSENRYRVFPPADADKWADICLHIVRHYNEGWADGLRLGIKYWSVWEEPNNNRLFDGKYDPEYFDLFCVTYKKLKAEFPDLKIGGPNNMGGAHEGLLGPYIDYCIAHGATPDFISFTYYARGLDEFPNFVRNTERILKTRGLDGITEIFISEWHYGPGAWDDAGLYASRDNEFENTENAAFSAQTLLRLEKTSVSVAYYYAWATSMWSIPRVTVIGVPVKPVYYGLKFFTEMTKCESSLAVSVANAKPENADFAAGMMKCGAAKVMMSFFKDHPVNVVVRLPGYDTCSVRIVSDNADACPTEPRSIARSADGAFTIPLASGGSAVVMAEFRQ